MKDKKAAKYKDSVWENNSYRHWLKLLKILDFSY